MSIESKDYKCPNCSQEAPEYNGTKYTVDGKEYPIFMNEESFKGPEGIDHSWDEYHKCPFCKTEYHFQNSN